MRTYGLIQGWKLGGIFHEWLLIIGKQAITKTTCGKLQK